MGDINQIIGDNLRKLRMHQDMTLDAMSEITGVSKSMLSEIERGGKSPTILVLNKIASGLRVPISKLMHEELPDVIVVDASAAQITRVSDGITRSNLFEFDPARKFEVYRLEIAPGSRLHSNSHKSATSEYCLVHRGTLTLITGNNTYKIAADGAIKFNADAEHTYINNSEARLQLTSIVYYL